MKKYEYRIVEGSDYIKDNFVKRINDLLAEGWRCLGGIAVSGNNEESVEYFFQAMIREIGK